ncbi:MAG: PQQ-binding-like beta-propeller repeat protein [bacterium]|nr:PQQ-binding-like beta-propeller repeat protein [bacterium]
MRSLKSLAARVPRPGVILATTACLLSFLGGLPGSFAGDWPLYSHDYHNSNFNPEASELTVRDARFLRRAWETFNDDTLVSEPTPTGFILEAALGLEFPGPVVGIIASPIVRDGTIYYADALGTVFARRADSGLIVDTNAHWTTTLVDPDFAGGAPPISPELFYTAPIVTDDHVWLIGSVYGRVHLVERSGGAEVDFDPSTPQVDPFQLAPDRPFASVLGDPVIVETANRVLLIASVNVIVNDALLQGHETGLSIAYDVTNPAQPVESWRTPTIHIDPNTGFPYGSGVSAGAGLAVDFDRGYVVGGTGQNTSAPYDGYPDPALAPAGYVDRGDSLYAIDFETGAYVWTNQFHNGDVFDLNDPVSTGPDNPGGPRDADVLSPPVLFKARLHGHWRDLAGNGSKGGLFRVVDRDTGDTVWERQISRPTGIGGIQAGAAVARGVIYVAGFEGIDDGFSDAQFGTSLNTGLFPNAFFATFSPAFWADVEDTTDDADPATGMRIKVYALDAATGHSRWHFRHGVDYVELPAGAALRHVSVTRSLVFVTASSGRLFVLNARNGRVLFEDQTPDLNDVFNLGLGKAHHASMNGGTVIANDRVYVPFGAQNDPSGGIFAYEINHRPRAANDYVNVQAGQTITIDALDNDTDPNGDALHFVRVVGRRINTADGAPDTIHRSFGTIVVVNPGDDPSEPEAAYLLFTPSAGFQGSRTIPYTVEDLAPNRVVNGIELDEPNPTHTPRRDSARIRVF